MNKNQNQLKYFHINLKNEIIPKIQLTPTNEPLILIEKLSSNPSSPSPSPSPSHKKVKKNEFLNEIENILNCIESEITEFHNKFQSDQQEEGKGKGKEYESESLESSRGGSGSDNKKMYEKFRELTENIKKNIGECKKNKKFVENDLEYFWSKLSSQEETIIKLETKEETTKRQLEEYKKHWKGDGNGNNNGKRLFMRKGKLIKFGKVLGDHQIMEDIYVKTSQSDTSISERKSFEKNSFEVQENIKQNILSRYEEKLTATLSKEKKLKNTLSTKNLKKKTARRLKKRLKENESESNELRKSYNDIKEILLTDIKDLKLKYDIAVKRIEDNERELREYKCFIKSRKDKNSYPNRGNITFVFTDIENSTKLWQKSFNVMAESLDIHNDCVRRVLKECSGYEVKTEGDAFMVAFSDTSNAVNFALKTQVELLKCKWPKELLDYEETKEESFPMKNEDDPLEDFEGLTKKGSSGLSKFIVWKGLRIRIAIHCVDSKKLVCKLDPVTKRCDYFGPPVNRLARILGLSKAGEILISNNVWKEVKDNIDDLQLEVVCKERGEYKLRGITTPEYIRSIYPVQLSDRKITLSNLGDILKMIKYKVKRNKSVSHFDEKRGSLNNTSAVKRKVNIIHDMLFEKIILTKKISSFMNRKVDMLIHSPDSLVDKDVSKERKELSDKFVELLSTLESLKSIISEGSGSSIISRKSEKKTNQEKFSEKRAKLKLSQMKKSNKNFYETHKFIRKKKPRELRTNGKKKKSFKSTKPRYMEHFQMSKKGQPVKSKQSVKVNSGRNNSLRRNNSLKRSKSSVQPLTSFFNRQDSQSDKSSSQYIKQLKFPEID